ncbi:MAG: restriction endonuclease subunit S, partial [Prevotella sp.]|nr:restriction endonuclease subunit S [Prevotella sp.]
METTLIRIGECINCNPSVKFEKGKTYPVIDIDKIIVGRKFVTNKDFIAYSNQSGAKFENGDTLMARITPCLENGKIAKAQIKGKGIGSTELFVFRGIEGITDNDFVYYLFKQQYIRELSANSMTGASGRQRADLKFIKRIKISLPILPIQCKIASILSAYDSLIENNTKRIRLLEQMAENLYKEWFVRFRFPGYENTEFVNGLPKGWKIERIGALCETIGGGTPSTEKAEYWNGNIKWVTPSDITSKSSLPLLNIEGRITEEGLKKSSAKMLPPHSILMTSRASIGFFGIAPEPVCTNQGFISIVPNEESMRMYMLYSLKMRREEIIANANGATFLEISKGRFRNMKMIVPTNDLLEKFELKCQYIFNLVLTLERQSALLTHQRDLLLPRLMSG